MGENNEGPAEKHQGKHTQRDAETQTALGIFVIVISLPVLVGTFWAVRPHAMAVNVIAGFVLLGVGVALVVWGRVTAKKFRENG